MNENSKMIYNVFPTIYTNNLKYFQNSIDSKKNRSIINHENHPQYENGSSFTNTDLTGGKPV